MMVRDVMTTEVAPEVVPEAAPIATARSVAAPSLRPSASYFASSSPCTCRNSRTRSICSRRDHSAILSAGTPSG